MDIQVKRDIANRIVEANGCSVNGLSTADVNYVNGLQDSVIAIRQIRVSLDPTSAMDTLNKIAAEVGQQALDQAINLIEIAICERLQSQSTEKAHG